MKIVVMVAAALLFANAEASAKIDKRNLLEIATKPIVVAVVDTGTDIYHKDLRDSIWTNAGESGLDAQGNNKENNKIDDDGNGFVDDLHGWNFVNNTNEVIDDVGHGTHIAGIIKREFNRYEGGLKSNSTFVPTVRLMILKYYNPKGKNFENLVNSTKAIQYANKMKVHVINYSGGGGESNYAEHQALLQSLRQKIVFVAAAGNNFSDTDIKKYYPANYNLANIISVAATDRNGDLMPFSNYGRRSIDIAAPGKWILSTLPNHKYGVMSGTSQATAHITGVVAKIIARSPSSKEKVYKSLLADAKFNKTLLGKTKTQLAIISDSK